ncbi:glycosyltransferase family 1 protein [Pseudonocardiaceae bacterium YIM PH 21723]|nr:glycosyltransferase family 1 protein [Pseudonocardiaceae bacterium YIM PH 21723]
MGLVRRTLLITNDFPPRVGGIQTYLHSLATRLPAEDLVVYAPAFSGHQEFDAAQPFEVVRHAGGLMLPVPDVLRRAREILIAKECTGVWFGASAPLALITPWLRQAGARRVLACTHGHEVGWSMFPGSRQVLRKIGDTVDVLTFVSRYTRSRFASAFGPQAALEYLPSGVDTEFFRPDREAGARIRERHGLTDRPVIVCVSRLVARKGQDMLVKALPEIHKSVPDAALLIVGEGPYLDSLRRLAHEAGVIDHVVFTGEVPWEEIPAHYNAGDVFAMPCRTRGKGLDVEGLGLVFLEAAACGLPVVAGRSGGAPEAVRDGETGFVVEGTDVAELSEVLTSLLADRQAAVTMGRLGRVWVESAWDWSRLAERFIALMA